MIQLYVDGKLVDIDKSVGLYLNKKFESLSNPTLYFSEYSKTITLPMTRNNKEIMFNYQRQDSVVTTVSIDPRHKTPFFLLYNGMKVMEGYLKINNANTCIKDNVFEIELFGSFGLIMNEFSQLTFNRYECESYGGTKEDKYLITSPWQDILVDASLVKRSFEQETHDLNGNDILDYIKFIPTYQGMYPDFESDKEQILAQHDTELSKERDEHYMREFRSYYQQPCIWVDKLWKMAKDKIDTITDYTLELDPSWFNSHNPYWTKLLYTCPNLYNKDENFVETSTTLNADNLHYKLNIYEMSGLSNHHIQNLTFTGNNSVMYRNGVFNPDLKGPSTFTMNSSIMFLAKRMWDGSSKYARIRKVNPLFVTFYVINADTGEQVDRYRYMLYTHSSKAEFDSWYDEKIDCGITNTLNPNILGQYPMGFSRQAGYWWEAPINLTFNVTQNIRYFIRIDVRFANNSKAVAYSSYNSLSSMWNLWFYQTQLPGGSGYTVFNYLRSASCSTLDYTRSRSRIDMYRVFPKKDVTLMNVLLNYSKQFGLLWDVDIDNKKITVMTRNRFFTGYDVIDWSKKIDRNKDFKLDPICFDKRYVNFNIEEGEGERYKGYFEKYGVGYGSKKIDTEYSFNSDTEDLLKDIQPAIITQKAQFSRITNTEDPDEPNFIGYNAKIYPDEHYLENDDDGENAGNSGALVFCNGTMKPDQRLGFRSNSDEGIVIVTDDTDYMRHRDTYMWNLSFLNTELCHKLPDISTISGGYSVHFESPAEYYFRGSFGSVRYLYDLYWKEFINERYNVQNKKLTCYVYLTPEEYKEIDFRNFVKIENTLYHINQVFDYDFDTNSPTKVELVQVWDTTKYYNGQQAWPALVAIPNSVQLTRSVWTTVDVYSSDEWTVDSKPSWVKYQIHDGRIDLKALGNPLRARTGKVILKTVNSPILEETVYVSQRPEDPFLIFSEYSRTVSGDGCDISFDIDSSPLTVAVVSKPNWVSVSFNHRILDVYPAEGNTTVKQITLKPDITKNTRLTCTIRVNENYRPVSRMGSVIIGNGELQKSYQVTQLGKSMIAEIYDMEPIHVALNDTGVWELQTNLEIDAQTAEITHGTISTPNKEISYLPIPFAPTLDLTDYGDGCIETCSGGQLVFLTKDGKNIVKNYNYGDVAQQYEVIIEQSTGGHFTVDNQDWYGEFYMLCDAGTTLTIEGIPDTGYSFDEWSDSNSSNPRTLTVNSDITLHPVFEEGGVTPVENPSVEYDDYDDVEYDNDIITNY